MQSIKSILSALMSLMSLGRSFVGYTHEGDLIVEERRFGRVRFAWLNRWSGEFPASKVRWTEDALDWIEEKYALLEHREADSYDAYDSGGGGMWLGENEAHDVLVD